MDFGERKPNRLIILEGPDCSGKSTLARELSRKLVSNYTIVHNGPFPRITTSQLPRFYVEAMFHTLHRFGGQILDRSWLSEPIYGYAFRDGTDRVGHVNRRHLERIAMRHGAVAVLCLPPWETVKTRWLERKGVSAEDEMLDKVEQLKEVYDGYAGLLTELPVVRYDYTIHGRQIDHILREVNRVGTDLHPIHPATVGNWNGKVILVGDKPSDHTDADTVLQFPFSSFSKAGSSAWLTEKLTLGEIRERDLLWCNADEGVAWIRDVLNRPIVALGAEASKRLAEFQIDHHQVDHPQHHKRFKSGEPYPLIALLRTLLNLN